MTDKSNLCYVIRPAGHSCSCRNKGIIRECAVPVNLPLEYNGFSLVFLRVLTDIQIPFMARMGGGRERKRFQAIFQLGPQGGVFLSDKTTTNFQL